MSIKSIGAKILAKRDVSIIKKWAGKPIESQLKTYEFLRNQLAITVFGEEIRADEIRSKSDWKEAVPLGDYEAIRGHIERIQNGERNILYPGLPAYFCKTSGTTSGTKYIPMTDHGIKAQIAAARNSLLCYVNETGNSQFVDGKMIFLQGSPELIEKNGISIGRLSGIVAHHVPNYLQRNRMPSWETNNMQDWEKKINAIVDETIHLDMRLISGIPPWVQMYFERLLQKSGKKTVAEIFPNFTLFAHGGVNFDPYRAISKELIGHQVDSIETYPASEGFIAFQDTQHEDGLLLNLAGGIFYEFIPLDEIHNEKPSRLHLEEVELNTQYAIVLNTSSGLWGYIIGDTVKFISLTPFRITVTGRVAHFISAFGEHVIADEVEQAMVEASRKFGLNVCEFHVAPHVKPTEGLPYHEWFIETEQALSNDFALGLDEELRKRNSYYKDLIDGKVLQPLKIHQLKRGSFNLYMDSIGKLGGQNKLPRLANDRKIADYFEAV